MKERAAAAGALGFTVTSGWAAAVLLAGPARSPLLIDSCRVDLSDPADPASYQPYHDGFGTARAERVVLSRLLRGVRRHGTRAVSALIRRHHDAGRPCVGVGVVVGSLVDPSSIANPHIRIHALEGRLFRGVVESAVAAAGLPCNVWRERDLFAAAAAGIEIPESRIRSAVAAMRSADTGPWRTEQKAAAVAAWLMLAGAGEA